ncbi:MAG: polysaccharide biosynthesis C-terminal domain-containing protein [Candidatus Improbicoccus pseudotrichonymphae]|uniref:Polysaccharide biosynthesis C-terminal domain-containing protein n=1 Tax=Candidatus Improbicoccus pseudotrichonymphae TaxID=3033792 RepID=A0AA48IGS9_9FIRM|nr:MAG: polysaccharide biosynthesis C-terminal domain-containing protein [Candidatus Improbicoccus pseudotrichonymphae]
MHKEEVVQIRKQNSFALGAVIITAGMFAVKIFGAFFKIPLMSILGGEGSAYFLGAYNFYNPIYALSTAGLPIAVSRLVSKNVALGRFKDVRRLHKVVSPIFIIMGTLGFVTIILGSFFYVNIAKSSGSLYSVLMLAPTLFFSCLISTYRGYYEGLRQMVPTAISEVIESIGKLIFGLSFTYLLNLYAICEYQRNKTIFGLFFETLESAKSFLLPYSSSAALLGVAVSAFAGYVYMFLRHKLVGDGITTKEILSSPEPHSHKSLLKSLLRLSIPIALGAIIMNISGVIDSVLIQRQLAQTVKINLPRLIKTYKGLIPNNIISRGVLHNFFFGCFGYTSTIVMFLPTVAQGISISALPTVTASWSKKLINDVLRKIQTIIKLTSIVSLPMGFGLSALSLPIIDLIYNFSGSNAHITEIKIAAKIMNISGIGAVFISLCTPLCSILQAIGRPDLPVKILSAGMIIKIILNYTLVSIPEINIQGAVIGTLVCYVFMFICLMYKLQKIINIKINIISVFLKPLIASVGCYLSANLSYAVLANVLNLNGKLATLISIFFSAVFYFFILLILKTLTRDDIGFLPKIKVINKLIDKFN